MDNPFPTPKGRAKPYTVRTSILLKGNVAHRKTADSFCALGFCTCVSNLSSVYPFTIQWHEKGRFFQVAKKY